MPDIPQALPKFVKAAAPASTSANTSATAPAPAPAAASTSAAKGSKPPALTSKDYQDMYVAILDRLVEHKDTKTGREIGKQFSEAASA